jgi:extracellular elastinolytic metalloproteinase
MNRIRSAALAAFIAIGAATPAVAATPQRPLRNVDVRKADGGPVAPSERRARADLERSLGDEGVVATDRISGGARLVARTDGVLTPRSSDPAATVALQYVREHPDVFGIGAPDLAGLRLTDRYRSDDGVTHLDYTQTYRGIASYDNVLLANVDEHGRLLNVGGSPVSGLRVDTIVPDISAGAALAAAREEVGGALLAPRARQGRGPERPTTFAGGDSARLVLFSDGRLTRLAWRVIATGAHDWRYEVVVDAASGATLKRRSLTEFVSNASVYRDYPGAPDPGGTPLTVDLAQDPTWLSRANIAPNTPKLSGENVHAYVDADANNIDPPPAPQLFGPTAGDLEVHPSSGTDWVYPINFFPGCSPAGTCTWNPANPSSRTTNRNQETTQLFYYVNRYHDHLEDPAINFTPATRNFEGVDPVQAETDNFLNPDGTAPNSVNNASMTTLPDPVSPLMQMELFTSPARSAADTADVVYHEYTHGLTNRSVGSGVGLDANQSRAMGEAWSDWYALDFLDILGFRTDSGGADGEMTIGNYLAPASGGHPPGFRTQGLDCPVGPSNPVSACPGAPGTGAGGYTFGDLGKIAGTLRGPRRRRDLVRDALGPAPCARLADDRRGAHHRRPAAGAEQPLLPRGPRRDPAGRPAGRRREPRPHLGGLRGPRHGLRRDDDQPVDDCGRRFRAAAAPGARRDEHQRSRARRRRRRRPRARRDDRPQRARP